MNFRGFTVADAYIGKIDVEVTNLNSALERIMLYEHQLKTIGNNGFNRKSLEMIREHF